MSHFSSPSKSSPAEPDDGEASSKPAPASKGDKFDVYDANIRNFAPVARIMKNALPENAKIAKEAKECMQECVSEFISFITSEASEKCQQEKRKTVNGEDILFAMTSLGFENYSEALKIYLSKYRDVNTKTEQPIRPASHGAAYPPDMGHSDLAAQGGILPEHPGEVAAPHPPDTYLYGSSQPLQPHDAGAGSEDY